MSEYEVLLGEIRARGIGTAETYIPKMYEALKTDNYTSYEAREKIETDLVDVFSKATIRKYLPEEVKDKKKSEGGKLGNIRKYDENRASGSSRISPQTISKSVIVDTVGHESVEPSYEHANALAIVKIEPKSEPAMQQPRLRFNIRKYRFLINQLATRQEYVGVVIEGDEIVIKV